MSENETVLYPCKNDKCRNTTKIKAWLCEHCLVTPYGYISIEHYEWTLRKEKEERLMLQAHAIDARHKMLQQVYGDDPE